MPLEHGKSNSAFRHNIKAEMHAGKPLKQSLAIAYAMKRRHKKHMAEGGFVEEEMAGEYAAPDPGEYPRPNHMAMEEDDRRLNQHGMHEMGDYGEDRRNTPHGMYEGNPGNSHDQYQSEAHEMDMVGRILKQLQHRYAKGGMVEAGDEHEAEFAPDEFDELETNPPDTHRADYTGANSGDHIGDEQEDMDRHDIVSRVMKSRRKKDHLPNPA